MDHLSEGVESRLGNGLRERRMRVDGKIDFFDRVLVLARNRQLVYQLGRVRTDDVGAQYLTVLRVADDLDEAFSLA